jgi:hypothetical protein
MKYKIILFIYAFAIFFSCKEKNTTTPHVEIQTEKGDIEIELYPLQAPKTVAAFLSYIDSGLYSDSSFYRVLNNENQPSNATKTELIQGGIWRTKNKVAMRIPGVPHETTEQTKYCIQMASSPSPAANREQEQRNFLSASANNPASIMAAKTSKTNKATPLSAKW